MEALCLLGFKWAPSVVRADQDPTASTQCPGRGQVRFLRAVAYTKSLDRGQGPEHHSSGSNAGVVILVVCSPGAG